MKRGGADQTEEENIGADQPARRVRLDQRETGQRSGADDRAADQDPVESE